MYTSRYPVRNRNPNAEGRKKLLAQSIKIEERQRKDVRKKVIKRKDQR
jgi:hypothetical protein